MPLIHSDCNSKYYQSVNYEIKSYLFILVTYFVISWQESVLFLETHIFVMRTNVIDFMKLLSDYKSKYYKYKCTRKKSQRENFCYLYQTNNSVSELKQRPKIKR